MEQVRSRVSDPRYIEAIAADLGGVHCSDIYARIFGVPKIPGLGRSNHYRDGNRECTRGYRLAGLAFCEEAMHEFKLIRQQSKEDPRRTTQKKVSNRPVLPQPNPDLDSGTWFKLLRRDRLSSADLELYAGSSPEELRKALRAISVDLSSLLKEKLIIETLLNRLEGES